MANNPLSFSLKISSSLLAWARGVPGLFAVRFQQYMFRAERTAKENVSGRVLQVQTGKLRSSIASRVEQFAGKWIGFLGAHTIYAAIHELGGTIPAHRVVALRASALHWTQNGHERFAKWVQIPTVRMPKRPYLMPALRGEVAWLVSALHEDMRNRTNG